MCAASIVPTRTKIRPAPTFRTILVRREITDQSLPGIDEAETPAPRGHSIIVILRFCILLLASWRLSKPYKLIFRAFFRLVRSGNVCADGGFLPAPQHLALSSGFLAYFPGCSNLRAHRYSKQEQDCREYDSHNSTPLCLAIRSAGTCTQPVLYR